MRDRGEAQASVLLGYDHPEEASVLHVLPGLGSHIPVVLHDLPVIKHAAENLGLVVDEGLLLLVQLRLRVAEKLIPVRVALE